MNKKIMLSVFMLLSNFIISVPGGGYFSTMSKVTLQHENFNPLAQQLGFAGIKIQEQYLSLYDSLQGNIPDVALKQSLGFKSGTNQVAEQLQDVLNITGSLSLVGNVLTITTDNGVLNDIAITGTVKIYIPTTGSLVINGVAYSSGSVKPGLIVEQINLTDRFAIAGRTVDIVDTSIMSFESLSCIVSGDLSIHGNDSRSLQLINTTMKVGNNITFEHNFSNTTNTETSSFIIGITFDVSSITANGSIFMNNNTVSGEAGSYLYSIWSNSTVIADVAIDIDNNTVTSVDKNVRILQNTGNIQASNINMTNNTATSTNASVYGLLNSGIINASNNIDISSNTISGNNYVFVIWILYGSINASNNITITSNSATGSDQVFSLYNNANITANGDISVTSNSANGNGQVFGIYNTANVTASGNITMNSNSATGTGLLIGVVNTSSISSGGSITLNQNNGAYLGVWNYPGSSMHANVDVYITLDANYAQQKIDSSSVIIKNTTENPLLFTDFIIDINSSSFGGVSGNTYSDMQTAYPGIINLNAANQA